MKLHLSKPPRLADFRADRRVLLLCLLAAPIGVMGAFAAKGMLWLIAVITNGVYFQRLSAVAIEPSKHSLGLWAVLVPVVGGLVIGFLARYGSEKIRGHGIPEALEAILLGRSRIDPKVAVLKPVSAAISIGTGGPFGAEGPIIMTGGAFGSLFAQLFPVTAGERKILLVAGAAAGMSAVFAAPVAAVLLAVELLLFEWRPRSFIPVAIASMLAAVVREPLLGAGPIFAVPPHSALAPAALLVALEIGIVAGVASGLLTRLVYACEDGFARLPLHWMWWPAIGGVVIGVGGLVDPRVLGVGYDSIYALLSGHMVGTLLVSLLVAKSVVWAIALGSGTSGGVLAPLLMIGGAVGALVGHLSSTPSGGLWAMVGMAAMMGGTMRAPLTGMMFLLELTHDLHALPALLLGTVAALAVTVLLLPRSILTEKLARRGRHIARDYAVDVFELTRVTEVMDRSAPIVPAYATVAEVAERFASGDPLLGRRQAVFVADGAGTLLGTVSRDDVERLQRETPSERLIVDVATLDPPHAYPDETLHDATLRMLKAGVARLPVITRERPSRIVGYLGRAEILAARQRAHEDEESRESVPLTNWG
jgi:CIC family chloride channel protein